MKLKNTNSTNRILNTLLDKVRCVYRDRKGMAQSGHDKMSSKQNKGKNNVLRPLDLFACQNWKAQYNSH